MAYVLGRGRRDLPPRSSRGGVAGSHLIVVRTISPTQPAPQAGFLYALPNDNALQPSLKWGIDHLFVFPSDCVLSRAHLHGSARSIGSVNTLTGAHNIDLYVNGERTGRLLTIPAGASTTDVSASPDIPIRAGDEVRFVVPVGRNATGALINFLFAFSIG